MFRLYLLIFIANNPQYSYSYFKSFFDFSGNLKIDLQLLNDYFIFSIKGGNISIATLYKQYVIIKQCMFFLEKQSIIKPKENFFHKNDILPQIKNKFLLFRNNAKRKIITTNTNIAHIKKQVGKV